MTTQDKIKVMKAYTEGKKIQARDIGGEYWWNVELPEEPSWDWYHHDYRIKPEEKYRPYKNTDEMIEDFKKRAGIVTDRMSLPNIWIREKRCPWSKHSIDSMNGRSVSNSVLTVPLQRLFDEYVYLDGTPCGIKE